MLNSNREAFADGARDVASGAVADHEKWTQADSPQGKVDSARSQMNRMLRIEWLGQTLASLCWIASVLSCGLGSYGDWLQLLAASSWLVANIASAVTTEAN